MQYEYKTKRVDLYDHQLDDYLNNIKDGWDPYSIQTEERENFSRIIYLRKPKIHWRPIETAPTDGTMVWVYVAEKEGLPAFQSVCAYHPDAGWCCDELREVTHWVPLKEVGLPNPQEG